MELPEAVGKALQIKANWGPQLKKFLTQGGSSKVLKKFLTQGGSSKVFVNGLPKREATDLNKLTTCDVWSLIGILGGAGEAFPLG